MLVIAFCVQWRSPGEGRNELREGTDVQGCGGGEWKGKERSSCMGRGGEAAEMSREKMHHSGLEEADFP